MNQHPILLIEDDENDVFFFQRAMKRASFDHPLQVARDGRQAIAYFAGEAAYADRAQHPLPCVVVLDLNLPYKNGLEVLKLIRGGAPDRALPVIVLTSSTSELDMREAYRLGANSYLIKPSQPEDLVEVVRALKLYWFDFNRAPAPFGETARAPD